MSNTERTEAANQWRANMEKLNAKYQAAIPVARKWAYSLTTQELVAELTKNGVSHVSDLVHIIARKNALA